MDRAGNPTVVGEKSYSYEEEGSSHSAKREKEEDSSLLSEVKIYMQGIRL
jgi:hypothetical protein